MSSIISALDRTSSMSTPDIYLQNKHYGENGTPQHGWGVEATSWTSKTEAQSLITQLYFQLVRTNDHSDLEEKMFYLLKHLNWNEHRDELTQLFRLTMHVRDIESGKGEWSLAYMMTWIWSKTQHQEFAKIIVRSFVINDSDKHPMGSWKDIKFMCKYLTEKEGRDYWLINFMIQRSVEVVMEEWDNLQNDPTNYKPSLVGRWMPREKQKQYKWIHKKMAAIAFPEFVVKPINGWRDGNQYKSALLKQKIHWNKVIVSLSKATDTPQIKMSGKNWSGLKFNNIPSICLKKNSNAIRNKDKKGQQRSLDDDRISCANNFTLHIAKALSGDITAKVHGKRLTVGELVNEGFSAEGEKATQINLQWLSNKENNSELEDACIIPCCDTSGSMESDDFLPITNAIGLSIRTSEICHKAFRNRILTFNNKPTWMDLSNFGDDFVGKVKQIRRDPNWGMNTNFEALCDKILEGLVSAEVDPQETKNIILAIYSDMQIDSSHGWGSGDQKTILNLIKSKFAEAGIKSKYKTPYTQPHILFWNLRKTSGFPSTAFDENVSFLSGYNSTLLNVFETKGINELRKMTPYRLISDILNNNRYDIGSDFIKRYRN